MALLDILVSRYTDDPVEREELILMAPCLGGTRNGWVTLTRLDDKVLPPPPVAIADE